MCMITKNSADTIVACLESWKPVISYWCILDTGSTDGTQDLIKETLKDIPGELHEEPFVDFSYSRNRCFDLAGFHCRYNIMPDDSYNLVDPEALINQLADKFHPVVSILIRSKNEKFPLVSSEYPSKRITLTICKLRYQGRIHEDIFYDPDLVLHGSDLTSSNQCYIIDEPKGSQHQRTIDRKEKDLELFTDSPRDIYLKGMTYLTLGKKKLANECFERRIAIDSDPEERFLAYEMLGHTTKDIRYYLKAAMLFESRAGEAYYFMYLQSDSKFWLKKAYDNRRLGPNCRLPVEKIIYEQLIAETYESEILNKVQTTEGPE